MKNRDVKNFRAVMTALNFLTVQVEKFELRRHPYYRVTFQFYSFERNRFFKFGTRWNQRKIPTNIFSKDPKRFSPFLRSADASKVVEQIRQVTAPGPLSDETSTFQVPDPVFDLNLTSLFFTPGRSKGKASFIDDPFRTCGLSEHPEAHVFRSQNRDVRDFRDVMTTLTVLTALNRNTIPDSGGHLRTFAVMSGLESEQTGTIRNKSGTQTGKIKTQREGEIMKRPVLNEMSPDEAMNGRFQGTSPVNIITMDPGQWDTLLQAAYERGWILLEVRNEMPVRAFRRLKA